MYVGTVRRDRTSGHASIIYRNNRLLSIVIVVSTSISHWSSWNMWRHFRNIKEAISTGPSKLISNWQIGPAKYDNNGFLTPNINFCVIYCPFLNVPEVTSHISVRPLCIGMWLLIEICVDIEFSVKMLSKLNWARIFGKFQQS